MDIDSIIYEYAQEFDLREGELPQEPVRIPERERRLLLMAVGMAAMRAYPPQYVGSEPTYHAVDYMPESAWDSVCRDIDALREWADQNIKP